MKEYSGALEYDPYDVCPEYQSAHFCLRLVTMDDAAGLLECYKNASISVQANAHNCTFGYGSQTLDEMRECVKLWLDAYKGRGFIRFAIISGVEENPVGTVEIFGSAPGDFSILRIDIEGSYEEKLPLDELIKIADSFFSDIGCAAIATRAVPEAKGRLDALRLNGYKPFPPSGDWDGEHYYIKYA